MKTRTRSFEERRAPVMTWLPGTLVAVGVLLAASQASAWEVPNTNQGYRVLLGERSGSTYIVYKEDKPGGQCRRKRLEDWPGFPNLYFNILGSSKSDIIMVIPPGESVDFCDYVYYSPTKIWPHQLFIEGRGGNDVIAAGLDDIYVDGGGGSDLLYGGFVKAGSGGDFVFGTYNAWSSSNYILAGSGDDTVCLLPSSVSSANAGTLKGNNGYDRLFGSRVNADGGFEYFSDFDNGCVFVLGVIFSAITN